MTRKKKVRRDDAFDRLQLRIDRLLLDCPGKSRIFQVVRDPGLMKAIKDGGISAGASTVPDDFIDDPILCLIVAQAMITGPDMPNAMASAILASFRTGILYERYRQKESVQ